MSNRIIIYFSTIAFHRHIEHLRIVSCCCAGTGTYTRSWCLTPSILHPCLTLSVMIPGEWKLLNDLTIVLSANTRNTNGRNVMLPHDWFMCSLWFILQLANSSFSIHPCLISLCCTNYIHVLFVMSNLCHNITHIHTVHDHIYLLSPWIVFIHFCKFEVFICLPLRSSSLLPPSTQAYNLYFCKAVNKSTLCDPQIMQCCFHMDGLWFRSTCHHIFIPSNNSTLTCFHTIFQCNDFLPPTVASIFDNTKFGLMCCCCINSFHLFITKVFISLPAIEFQLPITNKVNIVRLIFVFILLYGFFDWIDRIQYFTGRPYVVSWSIVRQYPNHHHSIEISNMITKS